MQRRFCFADSDPTSRTISSRSSSANSVVNAFSRTVYPSWSSWSTFAVSPWPRMREARSSLSNIRRAISLWNRRRISMTAGSVSSPFVTMASPPTPWSFSRRIRSLRRLVDEDRHLERQDGVVVAAGLAVDVIDLAGRDRHAPVGKPRVPGGDVVRAAEMGRRALERLADRRPALTPEAHLGCQARQNSLGSR